MITGRELSEFILSQGVGSMPFLADKDYSLPSRFWVVGSFSRALRKEFLRIGLDRWIAESQDCDDYAITGFALARRLHHKTHPGKTGIAFGEFWYTRTFGGAHAINVFVTRERNGLFLGFYEPQTQREVTLSTDEKATCGLVRF